MADTWGGSWGSSWGVSWTVTVTPTVTPTGGDDAYHHTGWDREAWTRRKAREDALEHTVEQAYADLMGLTPAPEVVKEVVAEVMQPETAEVAATDYSGLAEWLQAQEIIVQSIIARRLEEDDEEAILLLL